MGVDRPLVGLEGDAVDRVQELAAGEDPARLAHQGGQELNSVGVRSTGRPPTVTAGGKVDLDVGDPHHLWPRR